MRNYWVVVCCAVCVLGLSACENKPKAQPMVTKMEEKTMTVSNGSKVSIDYTLSVDGQVVDSSQGKGPLTYTQGQNQIIPGLEKQLAGLKIGDEKAVVVPPQEAYGDLNPEAVQSIPRSALPADIQPEAGMVLNLETNEGQPVAAVITGVEEENITIDLNHPLAGKTLEFTVKVTNIQ